MTGERAVTKPSVLGGLAMIPTFVPNDDICGFGGNSYLYALYYKTGTAYYKEVFLDDGLDGDNIKEMVALGPGMPAPFFGTHIGQQEGATALIQLGTGGIESIDVDTPYGLKSGVIFWKEE
jgi:type IV pilus assembly protein PilY1